MNGEAMTDLITMGFVGLLFWGIGYIGFTRSDPIAIPKWLSYLCGKKPGRIVYLRPFALQMFGLLLVIWAIILALYVSQHEQRVTLFSIGFLVIGILVSVFIGLGQLRK